MNKISLTLIILLFAGFFMQAAPARRGNITLYQPNGYAFSAVLRGDEFAHILTTKDGSAIIQDSDGYYSYAWFNSQGEKFSSGVHVGQTASSDVLIESRQIPYHKFRENAAALRLQRFAESGDTPLLKRVMKKVVGYDVMPVSETEDVITKHGLVILAEFSDVPFTYTQSDFQALLTQSGYSVNGATGSAKEYFDDQFNGMWEFEFTVSPVVTLDKKRSYYGGNDSKGNDANPAEMVYDACKAASSYVDFSVFDEDGDGEVDNVFVFFAGGDEAEGDDDDCIWSHSWTLRSGYGSTLTLNGVTVNTYACTSELTLISVTHSGKTYQINGIGTFCHEYSLSFCLPDVFVSEFASPTVSAEAAGMWYTTALMDGGNYNNAGMTPPYMNAVEREYLGINEPLELTEGDYCLEPINVGGVYYRLDTDTEGEYYLFECRATSGWDAYINDGAQAGGLMIYHIDKSSERQIYSPTYGRDTAPVNRWSYYNEVNANPEHQCADLIEADGRSDQITDEYYLRYSDKAGLFFPAGGSAFTPETTPAFSFWSGEYSTFSITDIYMDGENVCFSVIGSEDVNTPVATDISAVLFQDAAIITWTNDQLASRKAYVAFAGQDDYEEISADEECVYAIVLDYLTPATTYEIEIWFQSYGTNAAQRVSFSFTTEAMPTENAYPYIDFGGVTLESGAIASGSKIPLRVRNCPEAVDVAWTLGSVKIAVASDGYYTVSSGGTLKATITYSDGTKEVITRRITVSN